MEFFEMNFDEAFVGGVKTTKKSWFDTTCRETSKSMKGYTCWDGSDHSCSGDPAPLVNDPGKGVTKVDKIKLIEKTPGKAIKATELKK